jgi:hypothetical protein
LKIRLGERDSASKRPAKSLEAMRAVTYWSQRGPPACSDPTGQSIVLLLGLIPEGRRFKSYPRNQEIYSKNKPLYAKRAAFYVATRATRETQKHARFQALQRIPHGLPQNPVDSAAHIWHIKQNTCSSNVRRNAVIGNLIFLQMTSARPSLSQTSPAITKSPSAPPRRRCRCRLSHCQGQRFCRI